MGAKKRPKPRPKQQQVAARSAMRPRGFVTAESRAFFAKSCREGDLAAVLRELDAGTDPNQKDVDGLTALFCAAETGQLAVVEALCERGATPSKRCSKPPRSTPLHIAALNGHTPVVAYLRKCMGSAARTDGGTTALHMAAKGGHLASLQLLLPPMQWVKGRWRAPGIVDAVDDLGLTALSLAAMCGHDACVRALLEAGADWTITSPSPSLDSTAETGTSDGAMRSALTIADERDHVGTVAVLVNAPAVRAEGVRKRNAIEVSKALADVVNKIPLWHQVTALVDEVLESEAVLVAAAEIEAAVQRERERQAAEEAERQRRMEEQRRQEEEAMAALRRSFCEGTYAKTRDGKVVGVVSANAASTGERANMVRLRLVEGSNSPWVRLDDPLLKCSKAEIVEYDDEVARLLAERRAIAARALAEKRRAEEAAVAEELTSMLVDAELLWWAERVFAKVKLAAEIKAAEEARRHALENCPWGKLGCPNCYCWGGSIRETEPNTGPEPEPELEPGPEPGSTVRQVLLSEGGAATRIQAVQRGRLVRHNLDMDARAMLLRGLSVMREARLLSGLELAALRTLARIEDRLGNHIGAEKLRTEISTALREQHLQPYSHIDSAVFERHRRRRRARCDLEIREGTQVLLQVRALIHAAELQAAREAHEARQLQHRCSDRLLDVDLRTTRRVRPMSAAERRRQRRLRKAYGHSHSEAAAEATVLPVEPTFQSGTLSIGSFQTDRLLNLREEKVAHEWRATASR